MHCKMIFSTTMSTSALFLLCLFTFTNARNQWSDLDNLGSLINQHVHNSLKPLEGLGERIEQQVNEGLKPVRIMQAKMKVRFGQDGITVCTFQPSGKVLIFKEGIAYSCSGTISDTDGKCQGTLTKETYSSREDYCYKHPNAVVNNQFCFSNSGSVSVTSTNNAFKCTSNDGEETVIMSSQDYKSLCGNKVTTANYVYYTYEKFENPDHVINCSGSNPTKCTLSEPWTSNVAGVHINSSGGSYNSVIIGN